VADLGDVLGSIANVNHSRAAGNSRTRVSDRIAPSWKILWQARVLEDFPQIPNRLHENLAKIGGDHFTGASERKAGRM
jgi:hypothetical protein